ncbi:MAG: P-loop NTPase [Chlamydiia bacterium]|nr:P-loop NTPase [Chlamydiia bacterium]
MEEVKGNKKNLKNISFILGVLAGKGGVGKSTLTAELAKAFQREGKKVGVLDGDIYGPSLRHLLPETESPLVQGDKVIPALSRGIKVMSVAYFPRNKGPSVLRAPIANQIVTQFIEEVEWGSLDVLLVDFPPGTGDVQISLMQKLFFNGAVAVTTPQELSLLDVRKSMQMSIQMGVPLLGVVENMSFFLEPGSEKKHRLFGEGGGKILSEEFQVPLLAEIPIDPFLNRKDGEGKSTLLFDKLGKEILSGFNEEKGCKIGEEDQYHFSIEWLDGKKSLYRYDKVQSYCPCVGCLGEKEVLSNVMGEKIVRVGNYGIQIAFTDGCSKGIYPFSLLRDIDR